MILRVTLFLLCSIGAIAQDVSPFGLREGMTRKQVEQTIGAKTFVSEDGDEVTYSTAPRPHPDFDFYKLAFSRTYGLVQVLAVSKYLDEAGRDAAAASAKCEEIRGALTAKYGEPEVKPGTQCPLKFDKDKPCTMPTAYYTYWPPQDKIDHILLAAVVVPWVKNDRGEKVVAGCPDLQTHWAGQIMLFYLFEDFGKYKEEIKKIF